MQLCVRVHVGVRLACFLLGVRIKVALYLRPPVQAAWRGGGLRPKQFATSGR